MKSIHKCFGCLVLMLWIFCAGCSATSTDYPAAIMVDGEIYLYSVVPMAGEVDESAIIGYTESYTDEYPSENGQTNFNRELGMPYAKVEDGIAVLFQNEWHMCYPNSEKLKNEIIQTYAAEDKEGRLETYYEMADGTWGTEEHRYLYKLELTGRMHNAAKDSTFVCLSNSEDISFSEVSKSMISSNLADRLSRKEVVVVELLIVEEPKEDIENTMPPFTIIDGRYIWLSGKYTPIITPLQEKLDKAEYVGEITNKVSPNKLPSEELESNCFLAGRKLYHYQDDTMETYIVVTEDGTECYFAQEWYVYEKREGGMVKVEEHIVELFPTPTPVPGQDQALPTTMIDGEIYFMNGMYATTKQSEIERIKELIEQAEYLGTTTKNTPASAYPTEELDSNCLEEGSKIYRYIVEEKVNFVIVTPNEITYRYVSGWTKYRWFEDELVDAGKQEYNTHGMPTSTPTP